MKFNRSIIDEQLWQEYHYPANANKQKWVKGLLQEAYLKALDELTITIEENAKRIRQINNLLNENISEEEKRFYRSGIVKYGRTRIFPWLTSTDPHDCISKGKTSHPYILQTL